MPFNSYKKDVSTIVANAKAHPVCRLNDIVTWYNAKGRTQFITGFQHETNLALANANRSEAALIEQGYPKNVNEYKGKLSWNNYYIANALIMLKVLDNIFKPLTPFPRKEPDIFYQNIVGLVTKIFMDSLIVIDDWATFKAKLPGIMGVGKNRLEPAVHLYHAALQSIYGNYSPFAASDNHVDTSINQIRMAIELRIRWGFGIISKKDKAGSLVPLALSEIFTALKKYKLKIKFAVPLEHIERIYEWCNIYMHSGLKQYSWSPVYALHYLQPFLTGGTGYVQEGNSGWSVHDGISTSAGTVKNVQSAVEAGINKKLHTVHTFPPKECDLILI